MQRTYKSKRDTGGGLDPREVLFSLDDKSSAFDAFYIQNIKQTKRELSCMGTTNQSKVAANRVRKRKYVKRIVKEVEPAIQESMSMSTYLTPDKSIHVNKGIDLFDQLLKASPEPLQTHKTNKDNLFDQLRLSKEKKTYVCKQMVKPKTKKLNYSSSDSSDHEKENQTDLGKHELIIEKVTKTPKIPDDSINQIVNNVSVINHIIKRKIQRQSFNRSTNRLTNSLAADIGNSPLCSTPFVEKYRGKSIYRFSPIPMGSLDDSHRDNVDKSTSFALIESKVPQEVIDHGHDRPSDSPILTSKSSLFSNSSGSFKVKQKNFKSPNDTTDKHEIRADIEKDMGEDIDIDEVQRNKHVILCESSVENTPLMGFTQNTERETIMPTELQVFDQEKSILLPSRKSVILKCNISNLGRKTPNNSRELTQQVEVSDDLFSEEQSSSEKDGTAEASAELEPFFGFTESAINNQTEVIKIDESEASIDSSEIDITMVDVLPEINANKTDITEYLSNDNSANETSSQHSDANETNSVPNSENSVTSAEYFNSISSDNDDEATVDSNSERESLYDTCNSIRSGNESSLSEQNILKPKQPIVVLDRMNDSILKKYYKNQSDSDSSKDSFDINDCNDNLHIEESIYDDQDKSMEEDNEVQTIHLNAESSDSHTNEEEVNMLKPKQPVVELDRINYSILKKYNKDLSDSDTSKNSSGMNDCNDSIHNEESICDYHDKSIEEINEVQTINLNAESTDSQSNEEEEYKHVSFVTTRRRHEITNESMMIILDDSTNSVTSSEGNKTVLSNHAIENVLKDNIDKDDVELEEHKVSLQRNSTIRRDSRIINFGESSRLTESKLDVTEVKPIVLQPGKKWERSLSIYRRMTLQSDLEQSILEDEELTRKGRKYRESVIHTMEMQESIIGPLHNESFSSFRSSVVSKPHRTTNRLTKEPNVSRISLCTTAVFGDITGFLAEDCDDTVIELSKLSIGDAHEVTVVESQDSSVRGSTARDYVLRRCNQTAPILFDECYPDTALKNCHKIGEGVYGEVFLWRARDGHARVMKVVPIAGSVKVNGEHQKDFDGIITEIVIAMELSALRAPIAEIEIQFDEGKDADTLDLHTIENATDGFNEVIAVRCVYGSYPSRLLDLWELFDECKGSENDNPAALPPHQQYVVLELANAGQDLEGYQFNNAEQAYALFLQVAFTLAVGEEAFQFEHRDLHWGNVLIAPTEQKYATYVLRGRAHRIPRRGVAGTIIDYSLSRLSLPLSAGERAPLYNDLATDDGLFDAVGDYQFEVYRLMRDKLGNDWKNFEPYTNILWLHYTVDKMITALRYKRTNTKLHKHFIAKLKGVKNRILDYRSAVHFVLTDNE